MSDGKNILELVLNQNIAKKFNEIDDGVVKIQKDIDLATDSAGRFLAKMQELSQIFNVSGAGDFAANIDKLVQSMNSLNAAGSNTSGLVKQNEATQQIGQSAVQSVDDVNRLIDAINKIPEALNKSKQGAGGGEKKSILDSLLFDTKDLEAKRAEFASLIAGLSEKINSIARNNSSFDIAGILGAKEGAEQRMRSILESITKMVESTKRQINEVMTGFFKDRGNDAIANDKVDRLNRSYERLSTNLDELKKRLASGEQLEPLIKELEKVQKEYNNVVNELNTFTNKNNELKAAAKEVEGYKERIEEIDRAFDRLNKSNKARGKDGNLTEEAKSLIEEKKALEEKIRLYQMSADEAIKQEQRKKAEIEKSEKYTASEIKRLLDERLKLLHQIREAENKRDATQSGTEIYRLLNVQIEEYKKRLAEVTEATKNVAKGNESIAAEAAKAYSTKRAEQRVKEEEEYQNAIDKTIKELQRLKDERDKANQKQARESIGLEGGQAPKTIEQYRIAIKNLQREISQLNPSERSRIKELNARIREYQKEIANATGLTKQFRNENANLRNVLQQVGNAFGIYLGAQGITNFARNVVKITGEFELQHRAMQAIIGDMDAANRLWDKTIKLAVKSPYRVKDLVTYTKQLAAYRVETEKLYDTTKMLADISSGLGVDMQRLILAYGQVKAANYLRGQELRQFSEAGVNILGELSKYFTELEGRAVSVGDVFERVSKRMVSFEDVATVLHRLTEEGGMFYEMQEIQSETIKGQLENLKDSLDIFMSKIGEMNSGVIKSMIASARSFFENIQTAIPVINTAVLMLIARFVALRTITLRQIILERGWSALLGKNINAAILSIKNLRVQRQADTIAAQGATASMEAQNKVLEKQIVLEKKLENVKKAGGSAASGWIAIAAIAVTAIAALISKLTATQRALDGISKEIGKIADSSLKRVTEEANNYEVLVRKLGQANSASKERSDIINKINSQYGEYLGFQVTELTTIQELKDAYDEVNERLRNKAALEAYQQGVEKIDEGLEKIYKDGEEQLDNILKMRIGTGEFETVLGGDEWSVREEQQEKHLYATKADLIAIKSILKDITNEIPLDEFDEVEEQIELINNVIRKYFGDENLHIIWGNEDLKYFDFLEQRILKLNELGEELQNTMLLSSDIKEANIEIDKARKKYEEFVKTLGENKDAQKVSDVMKYRIDEAKRELEKKIIDIKVKFNIITQQQGEAEKAKIENWASETIKDINDKLVKNGRKYASVNDIYNFLYIDEARAEKGLTAIISEWKSGYDSWKAVYDQLNKAKIAGIKVDEEEYKNAENMMNLYLEAGRTVGQNFNEKNTRKASKSALDVLNQQIEAIKNAAEQYKKYQEIFGDTKAIQKTKAAVTGLFKEVGLGELLNKEENIFDESIIRDQMEKWLRSQIAAAGKAGDVAAQKYLRTLQLSLDKADYSKMLKRFQTEMGKAFDELDLGRELEKLGIGRDFAKTIFGVDSKTTDELRRMVEDWKRGLESSGDFGSKEAEEYRKQIEKINDIEKKQQKERFENYIKYMNQAMFERVRIEVDGLKEIAEIERTFQREMEKARKQGDLTRVAQLESMQQVALDGARRANERSLQKQTWEDFKSSDMYIQLFNDIDTTSKRVIEAVKKKVEGLNDSLNQLSPSDLKAITEEINKLEQELINRNPFKELVTHFKEVIKLNRQKKTKKSLTKQYLQQNESLEAMEQEYERMQKLLALDEQMTDEQIEQNGLTKEQWMEELAASRALVSAKQRQIEAQQKAITKTQQELQVFKNLRNAAQKYGNQWKTMTSTIKSTVDTIIDNMEIFGAETNNTSEAFGDLLGSILDIMGTLPLYIAGMTEAGIAVNSAMGIIGLIAEAVQLVITLIYALVKMGDAGADDTIDEMKSKVDRLADAYDRIKEKFDEAWDVGHLKEYKNQLKENIKSQIRAYNAMIDAEESKKSPDEEQIYEWKQAKEDLRDDFSDVVNDFKKELGGIGTDGFKDAAQEFVDAWADAFIETGDGLEAMKDHFNEFLQNLVKKQAMQRVASRYLSGLFDMIDAAIGDEGIVSIAEMDKIKEEFDRIAPQFSSAMQAIFESLGIFGDQASGELTGLQKGIQGVTEDTAEIIAAYLNAMRLIVIENGSKVSQLINIIQDTSGLYNPMLVELRNIKNRADDIYYFLNQRRENGTDSLRVYVVNA